MQKSTKQSKKQTQPPLSLAQIKRVLLMSQWIAAGGDRKIAAEAVGVGYTNAVSSLRAYGIPLRSGPTSNCRDEVLTDLIGLGEAVKSLILKVKKAEADG